MHTQTHTDPHLTLSLALFLSLPPSLPPSLPRCLSLPLSLSLSRSLHLCLAVSVSVSVSVSLFLFLSPPPLFLFSSDAARDGRHLGNSFINATCSQIFQNASYARTEDPNTGDSCARSPGTLICNQLKARVKAGAGSARGSAARPRNRTALLVCRLVWGLWRFGGLGCQGPPVGFQRSIDDGRTG